MAVLADEDCDRLSQLPDDILIYILSLQPTNSAAASSVLSRRWQLLWTNITRVDLYQEWYTRPEEIFMTLNHIFQQLVSSELDTFYLDATRPLEPDVADCFSYLNTLLTKISLQSIRKLNIITNSLLSDYPVGASSLLRVPACVLDNRHLVELKLHGNRRFDISPVSPFNVPNLKNLDLCFYELPYELLAKLLKCCPELETLSLVGNIRYNFSTSNRIPCLYISFQELEYLVIAYEQSVEWVIDAPNLKYFKLVTEIISENFRFVSKPTGLHSATFYGCFDYDGVQLSQVLDIFHGISYARHLTVDARNLLDCYDKLSSFNNLTSLYIDFKNSHQGRWNEVLLLLNLFPKLEYLKVTLLEKSETQELKWVASDFNVVPKTLTRVRKIKLKRLRGTSDDMAMIQYVLSNAESLKLLIISCYIGGENVNGEQLWQQHEFCRQVLVFPKRSAHCEIKIHGKFLGSSWESFKKRIA